MPGKNPRLTPLELRKKLLVAESELNRSQLVQECNLMLEDACAVARQLRSIGAITSAGALLFTLWRRRKHHAEPAPAADKKPSWVQAVVKGTKLATSLWLTLRNRHAQAAHA